jgi:hypothetical protein
MAHNRFAFAAAKIPLLTSKRAGEYQPARGNGYLAWEQNTRARPNWYNVYASPGRRQEVSSQPAGTHGAMGSVEVGQPRVVFPLFERVFGYTVPPGARTIASESPAERGHRPLRRETLS